MCQPQKEGPGSLDHDVDPKAEGDQVHVKTSKG